MPTAAEACAGCTRCDECGWQACLETTGHQCDECLRVTCHVCGPCECGDELEEDE